MKKTTKKLYFTGLFSSNPCVNEVVSNDPRDCEREKEYKASHEWDRHASVASEYFYVPSDFNPLGKTYYQCLEAGCKQITRQEDL
jgi:hypothetical protein